MQSKSYTQHQVLQGYVDYLNSILNQTITDSRLTVVKRGESLLISRFQNGDFLPLVLEPHSFLHFRQLACVNNQRKVIVQDCRYLYSTSENPDDEDEWIFRYEYSIEPDVNVPCSHLHLNALCNGCQIKHIHFPTGRISVEQIIAHLILEHNIKAKANQWFEPLRRSHIGFMQKRSDKPMFP